MRSFLLVVYLVFGVCGSILLSVLKANDHLNYSWAMVTAPAWAPLVLFVLYVVVAVFWNWLTWPDAARNRRYS